MHRHILKPAQNFLPNQGHRGWKEKPWQVSLICFDVSASTQLIHKERAHTAHGSNLHSEHLPRKRCLRTALQVAILRQFIWVFLQII